VAFFIWVSQKKHGTTPLGKQQVASPAVAYSVAGVALLAARPVLDETQAAESQY